MESVRLFFRDAGTLTHINSRHREERGIDTRSLFCTLWLCISWVTDTNGKPGEEVTGELDEDGELRGRLGIPRIDGWWVLSYTLRDLALNTLADAKRSSLNLIGRTVRLKLVAEDTTDIPKACQSFVATIHAIAPFLALEDYLKPRIAGIILRPDQLTPGLLQALIGSGVPSSALAQSILARLGGRPPTNGGSSSNPPGSLGSLLSALSGITAPLGTSGSAPNTSGGQADDSSSAPQPSTSENSGLARRRSMRLRGQPPAGDARSSNTNMTGTSAAADSSTTSPNPPPGSTFIHVEDRASSALAGAFIQQLVEDIVDPDDPIDNEVSLLRRHIG